MPVGVMFPLMTLQHFGGSTYDMSLIEIVWGGGALVGGAIMGARVYRVNRIVLINLMNFIVGVSFTLSGMLSPGAFALLRRALVPSRASRAASSTHRSWQSYRPASTRVSWDA